MQVLAFDADVRRAAALFLGRAAGVVGADCVFGRNDDRDAYSDALAFDPSLHAPAGAVAAETVEEIQALLRIANECGAPLWPISRGKNFGYGGSAPALRGTVVLDLSRMRRILEIDEKLGYCVVEPGVGFFDLYERLQEMGSPLWLSVPGNAWGSVAGNALERGAGPQPYGDHGAQICGLELVLPDGSLLRTGAGAMANSKTWNVARNAYGPGWDQIFCQSNFGVVTKLGLWLMPAPEATMTMQLSLPQADDLGRGVDMLYPLRQRGLIDHDPAWVSYVGIASFVGPRSQWYEGDGLLPEEIGRRIRSELGIGWWNAELNFYGPEPVIAAKVAVVKAALQHHFPQPLAHTVWRQGDPFANSKAGIPGTRDMTMIGWYGGRGGHIGFSPLLPANGALAGEQFQRTRRRYEAAGIDYYGAFAVGARTIVNINEILYDRDRPEMAKAVPALMSSLIADAAEAGYCEYRTHIEQMDAVAATFDFNDHAMRRLNGRLKDMLDPNGILAPGKQGIWPKRLRPR
ncbi:MAG: FAD-linked oxidase [Sphingomonas bacterium]|nr:FAD-binding oxidoreductase [Sphingomonas bacterium]MDB5689820.1 FAD-linked oxidase [Sphingomonas bacterium]